ncbi:hypothetical protein KCP75_15210 [Salmonella enterica subsp. enterica]|nr:hypothetical protein KCP75_15210 [Salmonella enterica subsp. enterica]
MVEDEALGRWRRRAHSAAYFEKRLNTRFVADALAKFLKIHAREVSSLLAKDKHAVTEQRLQMRAAKVPWKKRCPISAPSAGRL